MFLKWCYFHQLDGRLLASLQMVKTPGAHTCVSSFPLSTLTTSTISSKHEAWHHLDLDANLKALLNGWFPCQLSHLHLVVNKHQRNKFSAFSRFFTQISRPCLFLCRSAIDNSKNQVYLAWKKKSTMTKSSDIKNNPWHDCTVYKGLASLLSHLNLSKHFMK
jgi:hypothetical protein